MRRLLRAGALVAVTILSVQSTGHVIETTAESYCIPQGGYLISLLELLCDYRDAVSCERALPRHGTNQERQA
jgi:hypothetical protein